MKTQKMISMLTLTVGLLTTATAWALTPTLTAKTPVTQTVCGKTQEVPFTYLSPMEKRLMTAAVDSLGGDTEAAGCNVIAGSASCEGFGYVCWVQVLEGGPGEPDILDYGCGKQTC